MKTEKANKPAPNGAGATDPRKPGKAMVLRVHKNRKVEAKSCNLTVKWYK